MGAVGLYNMQITVELLPTPRFLSFSLWFTDVDRFKERENFKLRSKAMYGFSSMVSSVSRSILVLERMQAELWHWMEIRRIMTLNETTIWF